MPYFWRMKSLRDKVVSGLVNRKDEWPAAADHAQCDRRTVARIVNGQIVNPGVLTVEGLADFLKKHPRPRARV